ncbi:hypothetical protein ABW21_db0200623 [Orbilia brochopaga]|nr:hypothetical protein ABW21_db0200623 [Drechslerella brochopaga]
MKDIRDALAVSYAIAISALILIIGMYPAIDASFRQTGGGLLRRRLAACIHVAFSCSPPNPLLSSSSSFISPPHLLHHHPFVDLSPTSSKSPSVFRLLGSSHIAIVWDPFVFLISLEYLALRRHEDVVVSPSRFGGFLWPRSEGSSWERPQT